MPRLTKYQGLSDAELLQGLEENRAHSDVIEELCLRIELREPKFVSGSYRVECPVCEAELEVLPDEINDFSN